MFGRPENRSASANYQDQHVKENKMMSKIIGTDSANHQRQYIPESDNMPDNNLNAKQKSRPRRSGVKVRARKRRADQRREAEQDERHTQLVKQRAMEKGKRELELRHRDSATSLGLLSGAGDNHEKRTTTEKDVHCHSKCATPQGQLTTTTIEFDDADRQLDSVVENSNSARCVCALVCVCDVNGARRCLCADRCYCD